MVEEVPASPYAETGTVGADSCFCRMAGRQSGVLLKALVWGVFSAVLT